MTGNSAVSACAGCGLLLVLYVLISLWDRNGVDAARRPSLCPGHQSCLFTLLASDLGTCEPCIWLTMEKVGSGHQPLR